MKKQIREIGKRFLGNFCWVRKLMYYRHEKPETFWLASGRAKEDFCPAIKKDMVSCMFQYGASYEEYLFYDFLHKKDKKYRGSFVTDLHRFAYFRKCNKYKNQFLFDDKEKTYQLFEKYYGRKLLLLNRDSERDLADFIKQSPEIIAKPTNSSCGQGVQLIDTTAFENTKQLLDHLLSTGPCVIEERIIQSPQLAMLHPSSVNCARVATFLTGDKDHYEVEVFNPFLKIGRGASLIDNGVSVRGIIVKIDKETGILCTNGCDEASARFTQHPDTGITLKGYQLPDWDQAIQMVKELALVLPENRYIGWDLAHTERGWVIVEGNARGQFIGQQMADSVGRKAELDAIMKKVKHHYLF